LSYIGSCYCLFFVSGESEHDASLSEDDDGNAYDSDDLDEDLEKLKTSDPEFYKDLKECDKKLTNMTEKDDDESLNEDDDDYDEDDVEGIKSEKLHKPPTNLEVSNA